MKTFIALLCCVVMGAQQSQPVILGDGDCIGPGALPAHCWKPEVRIRPVFEEKPFDVPPVETGQYDRMGL